MTLPDNAEPGRLVRMPGAGKPQSNRAGWLKIFPDNQGAVFGDWSTDLQETWQARKPANDDELQRWRQIAEQAQAEAEQKRHQSATEAAQAARQEWDAATAPDALHGYLISKEIEPRGIKQSGDLLLIPVYTNGELSSLQRIGPDGSKRFMPGGKIKGGYHLIGDPAERVVIAEGYATSATIHEATGEAVAVAFNAGNLQAVAEAIRAKYPEAAVTIAADDDRNTEGNPGIRKATEAATAVKGAIATPGKAGDFNDLYTAEGADAVAERIKAAAPVTPKGFRLVRAGTLKAKDHDWLIDGLLERDSLAAFFGPPETWKSLYMIDACCSIAHGVDFHGAKVKRGNAVYVCGEGFAGLARRFKAWCIRHDINPDENQVMVSTQAAQLNDPETFAEVADKIAEAEPDLVVIDTLARNFGPGDENATSDMTGFIAACDRIRGENGCTVALVHHSGLMDKTRGRGNSALKGALDWEYMFKRTGDVVEVECSKVKDADRPPPQAFTLDIVIVDEAKDITSVTLAKSEPPQPVPTTRKGKHQLKALA
ncbi:MAG: AAA family ATPase, partial [Wenzhouxiangellaceae bacterium]